jgi:hypothetical protein
MPNCCVDGSCRPNMVGSTEDEGDYMKLPYGVRCEHCANFPRCRDLIGKKETDDECDWFPRKFRRPMP